MSKAQGGQTGPSREGVWGSSPKKISEFKMSVEAVQMNFVAIFSCENKW